jgi:diguanylate cyclase (GGDEF)-like protein
MSIATAIQTKSGYSIEYRILTKSGNPLWFRNDASFTFDADGHLLYIQGVLQEIHQRKMIGFELNRLYHEEHLHRLMIEGLTVSSSILSATMDIDKIPDMLLQEINHILPYDTATFWVVEDKDLVLSRTRKYSLMYGENVDQVLVKRIQIEEAPALKLILESGRPLIVEKFTVNSDQAPHSFSDHIHSWAGAPIIVNGKPVGLFTIESCETGRFTENMRSILSAFCGQASMSFQNARLFKNEQLLRSRAELLQKATAALTAELELPQLLEQVMDYLGGVVPYDSVCLFLLEGDNQMARAVAGRGFPKPKEILDKLYQANDELFSIIAQQKSPLILADTNNDPRFKRWGDAFHIRGWMGVPLIWREKVIGFMTVDSRSVNTYNEDAAKFAQAFANQAASAIQIARLFSETQALAITDPLTGLPNRRRFFELGVQLVANAEEQSQTISTIMIDIDNYKKVNDTYGHLAGDQILKAVTDCFTAALKPGEMLGRLGGDEFTILLPGLDRSQAKKVAERLRSTLENACIELDGKKVVVTASFGVAEIDPSRMDLDDMINRADQALYKAKNTGRNMVL